MTGRISLNDKIDQSEANSMIDPEFCQLKRRGWPIHTARTFPYTTFCLPLAPDLANSGAIKTAGQLGTQSGSIIQPWVGLT
jgi:hypothetical protein